MRRFFFRISVLVWESGRGKQKGSKIVTDLSQWTVSQTSFSKTEQPIADDKTAVPNLALFLAGGEKSPDEFGSSLVSINSNLLAA